jgi:hypothetical protein
VTKKHKDLICALTGYTRPIKFSSTNNYGCTDGSDVYTVEEFRGACRSGGFMDYDGFGYPVKDNMINITISVNPSQVHLIPEDATHIVWYNK